MPRPIHFEIQAENAERAIAFYRELLGWETEHSIDEAIASALARADRRQDVLGYE